MGFLRKMLRGAAAERGGAAVELEATITRNEAPSKKERRDLRSPSLPAGYIHLIQGAPVEVVGESRYQIAIANALGRRPEGHRDIVDAAMVWQPGNAFDPNAVAIQVAGHTWGYLAKVDATRYRPVMERCHTDGVIPMVRGDVHGGWQQPDGKWADFGITLCVASPEILMAHPH